MPNWIFIAAGAVPALLLAWLLHTVDVDRIEAAQKVAIADQQAADKKTCDSDKSITKEANDALQKSNANCSARVSKLMRLQAQCVPLSRPAQLAGDKQPGSGGSDGLSTLWLQGFAEQCKEYRDTLIICEDYAQKAHDACNQP